MKCCRNVGPIDRGVRAIVGVIAVVLAFTALRVMDGAVLGVVAAAIGGVMIATAAIGFCPLYIPLRLSTCKVAAK